MSARGGLLPGGGVALPLDSELRPLEAKHKAVILYYMYFASRAALMETDDDKSIALQLCAKFTASVFCKKMFNVGIHPDAIEKYHSRSQQSAEAVVGRWDQLAVAQIISTLVEDEDTFDEVISFVGKCADDEATFNETERWFLQKVNNATRSGSHESRALIQLRAYWNGAVSAKKFRIEAAQLTQSLNIDPKHAINYQTLCDFQHDQKALRSKKKPFNRDD